MNTADVTFSFKHLLYDRDAGTYDRAFGTSSADKAAQAADQIVAQNVLPIDFPIELALDRDFGWPNSVAAKTAVTPGPPQRGTLDGYRHGVLKVFSFHTSESTFTPDAERFKLILKYAKRGRTFNRAEQLCQLGFVLGRAVDALQD